ncbi:MAG: hypothetical protein JO117_07845 [Verrucomicrobia bacterium]|nr:hypothetical protein [Verrucomicrobiota bacterium]MBV9657923.1 hypothetical protein [Verrucomicrobiota bacterium]
MAWREFLGRAADAARGQVASTAGRQLLRARLAPYGDMLNFQVDPAAKTIALEILLKGETEPLRLTLSGYELRTTDAAAGGKTHFTVAGATASREWVHTLLRELLVGREIELPPKVAPLLRLLV